MSIAKEIPRLTEAGNAPPKKIVVGGQWYTRADSDAILHEIEAIPFDRIPGKSMDMLLYRSFNEKREGLILHTPATLNLNGSGVIAKKRAPWSYKDILQPDGFNAPPEELAEPLARILTYDHVAEGDSVRLFNYLVNHDPGMPPEFWPVMILWLKDEMNHCKGFYLAKEQTLGTSAEEDKGLAEETSDFEQFHSILCDPFKVVIALSYDEASTIAGYNHDLPYYSTLGSQMVSFVRRVSGDEGWHFSKFLALAVKYFEDRLDEVPQILREASQLDGQPYRRTFFLDHDPRIESQFNEALKRRSSLVVLKTLGKRRQAA